MADHTQQQHANAAGNEFDAAKVIVETLKSLDSKQQERAIRFASETLGLHSPSPRSLGSPPTETAKSTGVSSEISTAHPTDIKQFSERKSPKSDQQFAAVVAYFYRFEAPPDKQKDDINADDLNEAARLVNRKRPANALATLNNAKNSGYLDAVGKGQFRINSVGENLVAMTLPGDQAATSGSPHTSQRKKRSKNKVSKKTSPKRTR